MADSPRDDLLDILEAVSRAQLRAIRRLRLSPKAKSKTGVKTEGGRLSGMDMVTDILRPRETAAPHQRHSRQRPQAIWRGIGSGVGRFGHE